MATRRNFIRSALAAGAATSLPGCGGGDAEQPESYGFYVQSAGINEANAFRANLAKFDNLIVDPEQFGANTIKTLGVSKVIAHVSLSEVDLKNTSPEMQTLKNAVQGHFAGAEFPLYSQRVVDLRSVDLRDNEAYKAMSTYLKSIVDKSYDGVFLDGLEVATHVENDTKPKNDGLTKATVRLMYEIAIYAKSKGKKVMVAGSYYQPQASPDVNPLAEAAKVADVLTMRGLFFEGDEVAGRPAITSAQKQAILRDAIKASGKNNLDVVDVALDRSPTSAALCEAQQKQRDFAATIPGSGLRFSTSFDHPRNITTGNTNTPLRAYSSPEYVKQIPVIADLVSGQSTCPTR